MLATGYAKYKVLSYLLFNSAQSALEQEFYLTERLLLLVDANLLYLH